MRPYSSHVEGSINDIVVFATQTQVFLLKGPCHHSKVVLNDDDTLDELHPVVVQLVVVVSNLLALEMKLAILLLLLMISLGDQLLEVVDLLVQVVVDILQFALGHLEDGSLLGLEDLHLVLAKVELFAGFINLVLNLH